MTKKITNDQRIGKKIRVAREHLGYTLQMLGDEIGVNFNSMSKKERGLYAVSAVQLAKLAVLLEKPIAWFVEDVR